MRGEADATLAIRIDAITAHEARVMSTDRSPALAGRHENRALGDLPPGLAHEALRHAIRTAVGVGWEPTARVPSIDARQRADVRWQRTIGPGTSLAEELFA